MRYQPIYDIAEICFRQGVRNAVVCPGSRCAPLTLAFTRHPGITTRTFSDERSAGFVALGMAQALDHPVVVVCTSGTAAYNLAPAVAEAFFSNTPLLVLTADRPVEWIGQHDGQTIFQNEIFGRHVRRAFQLPQDYEHPDNVWAINRIVNEALIASRETPAGPVHINAPFREPLYPEQDTFTYSKDIRIIGYDAADRILPPATVDEAKTVLPRFNRVLVVAGQQRDTESLPAIIGEFQNRHDVPVVHDILSNLHGVPDSVSHSDLFLGQGSDRLRESLRPDLLITFGDGIVSKNLKLFLRAFPPDQHWHVQPGGPTADTYCHLTRVFNTTPALFFKALLELPATETFKRQKQANYYQLWDVEERRAVRALDEFMRDDALSELTLVERLLSQLPDGASLHLANSMSVRYANMIGLKPPQHDVRIWSNRGTSGIDGSTSTTVGHALVSDGPHFLITGDLAFFYDRNAFWHNYPLKDLRILLLNNHGGLIFDILDGPSSTPEAREYFITRQPLNARKLCEEFGFDYLALDRPRKVANLFKDFLTFDGQTKIMEFESDTPTNKKVFENLKLKIKKSYGS